MWTVELKIKYGSSLMAQNETILNNYGNTAILNQKQNICFSAIINDLLTPDESVIATQATPGKLKKAPAVSACVARASKKKKKNPNAELLYGLSTEI